ncbi:MAG: beta-propeller fold lactonase family protein [Blastocatellia bacterium]|nr:beta-propeller fold lactonase family protein [Blastocatellia bacterium]MBL8194833.1 beta-propeller fold lactonase family protein [Blastocatellia bacterium]
MSKTICFLVFCLLFCLTLNLTGNAVAKTKRPRIITKIKNVGLGPDNLAFSPDGRYLFVSSAGPLYLIDTANDSSLGEFLSLSNGQHSEGSEPSTLVFTKIGAENFNFATNFSGSIAVVDISQLPKSGLQSSGGIINKGIVGGVINNDGTVLYAINKLTSKMPLFSIFKDPNSGLQIAVNSSEFISDVGKGSSAIVKSLDGKFVYVANSDSQDISIVDLTINKVINKVVLGAMPMRLALSPKGDRLYITLNNTGELAILDTSTNKILSKISQIGEGSWDIALNSTGSRAYISNNMSGDLTIVNTTNSKIIQKISNIGLEPRGIKISPKGDKLYVANFLSQSVTVISLKNSD